MPIPNGVLLVIPDIPPTPGVCGLTVSCKAGKLTIAEGSENPMTALVLNEERAKQVYEAIGRGLASRLCIPPPPGEEPGYWESAPTDEHAQKCFRELKALLKEPGTEE